MLCGSVLCQVTVRGTECYACIARVEQETVLMDNP